MSMTAELLRFERYLHADTLTLFRPGGDFDFVIEECLRGVPGNENAFDIHLREKSELMVYHGGTRILIFSKSGGLSSTIDDEYTGMPEFEQFRRSIRSGKESARRSLREYLFAVTLKIENMGWYRGEYEWQGRLARNGLLRGANGIVDLVLIDREAVVGVGKGAKKSQQSTNDFYSMHSRPFIERCNFIRSTYTHQRFKPKTCLGNELDFLALNRSGQLVCVELKCGNGNNFPEFYWSPMQAGVYRSVFQQALPSIVPDVLKMVAQKISLGILPEYALSRVSKGIAEVGKNVLVFANPYRRNSRCWAKLQAVVREYPDTDANVVLLNGHDVMDFESVLSL